LALSKVRTESYAVNGLRFCRAEDSDPTKGYEYFYGQRDVVRKKGFRIKSIISSHMDAVTFPESGERNFLLPVPLCDKFEKQIEHRF